jgi:hypothetical protein
MPDTLSGLVTALYLFDVAEAIDLGTVKRQLGENAAVAKLDEKSAGPVRLYYQQPPVIVDGPTVGVADIDGFRVRVKFYDYGVISLMLSRPFQGAWTDLAVLGQAFIESEPLENDATRACHAIVERIKPALSRLRTSFLSEDYFVFAVTSREPVPSADDLVVRHGREIAQLLRGERQDLSADERDRILRNQLSYFADDLVIPAWNAAFVYDTEPALFAAIEIFEYANSQLLQYRYHDDVLETELNKLYVELNRPRWSDRISGRRHTRAARHVQSLVIDINELTDRTENTVKFTGDIYSARLFGAVAERLGLDRWKNNVKEKLQTLDDIHRFAVERTATSHANLLEAAIVFILVLELALFFAGIMR